MQFDIQSLNFPATSALASHTRRRLGFGLTRHANRITRVVVRLGDENGPRGGPDKFCRLQVNLVDAPQVVISDCGPDLYAVIDRASDRAARAVAKQLERNRFGRQRPALRRVSQPDVDEQQAPGSRATSTPPLAGVR